MGALRAPVATHAHMQDRGAPPVRLVRQAPDHRVTSLALTSAASTPPVLTSDPARQHCMVWPHALARHLQPQVIQACERAQVRAIKDSIGHVEVFRMDGVGISIIERPRPLPGHDTPNPHPTPLHPQMRRAQKAPSAIRCIKTPRERLFARPHFTGQKAPSAIRCIKTAAITVVTTRVTRVRKHRAP